MTGKTMSIVAELEIAAPAAAAAYEIRASLTLTGFDGDPDAVSAHLDLQPTRVRRRSSGLYRALRLAGPDSDGANEWVFRPVLDLPEPRPARLGLAELLHPLRAALEARCDRLATLPRCSREIRIEILSRGMTPEIVFAEGDLDFLTRLGLPFALDIRTAVD